MKKFHKIFSKLLDERSIRQKDMAKAIGVTQGSISKYKSGNKEPSLTKVLKMAEVLDISLDELLVGKKHYSCPENIKDPMTRQLIEKVLKLPFTNKVELHQYVCRKYP